MIRCSKTSKFSVFSLEENIDPAKIRLQILTKQVNEVFNRVTYECAKDASLEQRSSMTQMEKIGLTYGEVIPSTMVDIFNYMRENDDTGLFASPGGRFYDLGAGSGRPVVLAALLHQFEFACGIEILSNLFDLSKEVEVSYKAMYPATPSSSSSSSSSSTSCSSTSPLDAVCSSAAVTTDLRFIHGSITDKACCDWTDGDVVFVNSTAFHAELFEEMVEIAKGLQAGSWIITLTSDAQSFAPLHFKIMAELRLSMSW